MFTIGGGKHPNDAISEFMESAEFEKTGSVAKGGSSSSGKARPFGLNNVRPPPLPRPPGMPTMHPHLDHAPITPAPLVNDQPILNPAAVAWPVANSLVDIVR